MFKYPTLGGGGGGQKKKGLVPWGGGGGGGGGRGEAHVDEVWTVVLNLLGEVERGKWGGKGGEI